MAKTMNILLPHNHFDADHLKAVIDEMRVLGAPTIKAVNTTGMWGAWVALEGCHRIRAAAALGLTPVIEEIEWSDTVTTDEVVPGSFDDTWTIEQVVDSAQSNHMVKF